MIYEEKQSFYLLNYPPHEKGLCNLEMECIFGEKNEGKYILSSIDVEASRSPFIKEKISSIYIGDELLDIVNKIEEDKLSYDDFKVVYLKFDGGEVNYKERLNSLSEIGRVINGYPDLHNPKVILGITKANGKWIFGEFSKNDFSWHKHDNKPFSYSNALTIRMAKAIVNIGVGQNINSKVIDPCCGIGTVVMEGLHMGIDIKGCELCQDIAENAKMNLKHFGYKDVILNKDMHTIEEHYDVCIIDLPYGLFTYSSLEEQIELINTSRRIGDRAVIVTFENMDKYILEAGFKIIGQCSVRKNNFNRVITLCI
ncbi:MAG: TRM11 family SAM-dependent methyltransferase [Clostridium sp.]